MCLEVWLLSDNITLYPLLSIVYYILSLFLSLSLSSLSLSSLSLSLFHSVSRQSLMGTTVSPLSRRVNTSTHTLGEPDTCIVVAIYPQFSSIHAVCIVNIYIYIYIWINGYMDICVCMLCFCCMKEFMCVFRYITYIYISFFSFSFINKSIQIRTFMSPHTS